MTFTELLNNNKDICDIVGPDVGCSIKAMLIVNETKIAFLFAPYYCCDMTKIIAFTKLILPEVKTIHTFSGNILDTSYHYKNDHWESMCHVFKNRASHFTN
jgi:hypothetical protein